MVDLAVPRDIEPEVGELRDIYLYSIDDLQEIIDANLSNRHEAAKQAEQIIALEIIGYKSRKELKAADQTLVRFRELHEAIKRDELAKAAIRLDRGDDPTLVLNQLANQLTNKIIHTPSVQLKAAAATEGEEFLAAITKLYQLDDDVE